MNDNETKPMPPRVDGSADPSVSLPAADSPMTRRSLLRTVGFVSLSSLAVGGAASGAVAATKKTAKTSTGKTTCANAPIPTETAGPFPGDGSNGVNILNQQGVVRSDITSSFGSSTAKAAGIPLTVILTVVDSKKGCAVLPGASVYLWHADQIGQYSMYTAPAENYLRGVQAADTKGAVTFKTVFPGAYDGRWPHMHFEVFANIENALARKSILVTSQLALPESTCKLVYATKGYETSIGNLSRTSLARDLAFRDGAKHQMATMSGSVSGGFTARLTVAV